MTTTTATKNVIKISDIKIGQRLRKNAGDVSTLAASIARDGLYHPIGIDKDNNLIFGLRRIKAYEFLGRTEIPYRRVNVENPTQAEYDENAERSSFALEDIVAIHEAVKASRVGHRVAKSSDLTASTRVLKSAAKGNEEALEKLVNLPTLFPKGPSDVVTGRIVGHSETNVNKIVKIVNAAEKHTELKEVVEQINKGEKTLEYGYKKAQVLIDADKPNLTVEEWGKKLKKVLDDRERFDEFGKKDYGNLQPKFNNVWNFKYADPRLGRIPGQVAMNVLYYYSKPNDLVIDPMSVTGSTIDACTITGRRCIALGNIKNPARGEEDDIRKWDTIKDGLPPEAKGCDLIFLDPQFYWKLQDGSWYSKDHIRSKDSIIISSESLEKFMAFMKRMARDCHEMLKIGGHVAVILQPFTDEEADNFVDLPFDCFNIFTDVGFASVERIGLHDMPKEVIPQKEVEFAIQEKKLVDVIRDIIIFRKERREGEKKEMEEDGDN